MQCHKVGGNHSDDLSMLRCLLCHRRVEQIISFSHCRRKAQISEQCSSCQSKQEEQVSLIRHFICKTPSRDSVISALTAGVALFESVWHVSVHEAVSYSNHTHTCALTLRNLLGRFRVQLRCRLLWLL